MPDSDLAWLASRLRQARLERRMTLRDLAQHAGCSLSLLSKIEHGRTAPSLRMLHRIAAGLQTTIGALVAEENRDEVVIYPAGKRPRIELASSEGGETVLLERLAPRFDGQMLDGNLHVVAPGAGNGGEISHAGEELGYVIAGRLELTVAGRRYDLTAGDSFFFRSELPHSYRNLGQEEARVLWIAAPPTF